MSIAYINRAKLIDLLSVAARFLDEVAKQPEIPYVVRVEHETSAEYARELRGLLKDHDTIELQDVAEMKRFEVTMHVKRQIMLTVDAKNEAEALKKAGKWDAVDEIEQDQLDWCIVGVRKSK